MHLPLAEVKIQKFDSRDAPTCAVACDLMHNGNCPNFLDPENSTDNCLVLPETDKLVRTSEYSLEAYKVWFKEPIITTPHFAVFQRKTVDSGYFEDYSLDPEKSPPITSFSNVFSIPDATQSCGTYLPGKRKVILKPTKAKYLYEWKFDGQGIVKLPPETEDKISDRRNTACASQNGKLIAYGGSEAVSTYFVYQGGIGRTETIPDGAFHSKHSCAAFHPQNRLAYSTTALKFLLGCFGNTSGSG